MRVASAPRAEAPSREPARVDSGGEPEPPPGATIASGTEEGEGATLGETGSTGGAGRAGEAGGGAGSAGTVGAGKTGGGGSGGGSTGRGTVTVGVDGTGGSGGTSSAYAAAPKHAKARPATPATANPSLARVRTSTPSHNGEPRGPDTPSVGGQEHRNASAGDHEIHDREGREQRRETAQRELLAAR